MSSILAGKVEFVVGVDTHRDSHTAAIVSAATGGVVDQLTVATDAWGYRELQDFADRYAPGRRVWAIEGTGSYGSGLTTALLEHGQWVVEIDRPTRPARRDRAKSDDLDAVRAAREALGRDHLALPRARGDREALRVLTTARAGAVVAGTKAINQLKALIVNAPQPLREQLRHATSDQQLRRCARLRTQPTHSIEHRATIRAIRGTARRALALAAPNSSSPDPTPAGSATRPRSLPWPVPHRSRPAAAPSPVTDSTAPATDNSTGPCTPWP